METHKRTAPDPKKWEEYKKTLPPFGINPFFPYGQGWRDCIEHFDFMALEKAIEDFDTKTVTMPKELTAENGAKGLLIGEFKERQIMSCPSCSGEGFQGDDPDVICEDCEGAGDYSLYVTVSWTTIKEIYAMAVKHLSTKFKFKIGDQVKLNTVDGLYSGCQRYPSAIIKSLNPLVLISEKGDMTWRTHTIDELVLFKSKQNN